MSDATTMPAEVNSRGEDATAAAIAEAIVRAQRRQQWLIELRERKRIERKARRQRKQEATA